MFENRKNSDLQWFTASLAPVNDTALTHYSVGSKEGIPVVTEDQSGLLYLAGNSNASEGLARATGHLEDPRAGNTGDTGGGEDTGQGLLLVVPQWRAALQRQP